MPNAVEMLEYRNGNIPLADIPFSQERLPRLRGDVLNTAGHELNHALIARELGVSIALVSVRPEGHSLGRTVFYGRISPETFKLIAAGGTIDTPHGTAKGYGGDVKQIEAIDDAFSLHSENLFSSADQLIKANCSNDVRKKAAEIIAYIGMNRDIHGSELGDIMHRAEIEVQMENSKNSLWKQQIFHYDKGSEPQPTPEDANKYTIIEHLDNGMFHIKYSENNLIEKEFVFCGECGEVDDHARECSKAKPYNHYNGYKHYNSYTEHPLKNTLVIARLPKSGRVYDSN